MTLKHILCLKNIRHYSLAAVSWKNEEWEVETNRICLWSPYIYHPPPHLSPPRTSGNATRFLFYYLNNINKI